MTPTTPLNSVVPQTGNQWTTTNAGTFIENVKGPTSAFTGFLQTYPAGTLRTTIATAYSLSTQNVPDLPLGKVWKLDSFTLTKGEPGVHSVAQLVWKAAAGSESGLSSTYQWNMEWQAYTMNLLAFCKNQLHNEHIFGKEQLSANETAYAPYIKSYLDSSNKNVLSSGEYLYKKQQQGAFFQLNKHESEIAKKMQGGVEFVEYHRPVVTKITTSPELSDGTDIGQVTGFDNIGENIDVGPVTIEDLPFDIQPPTNDFGDWVYKKSLDSVQVKADPNTGISVWTRTEQWQGALSIDLNLYGSANIGMISGRWMIGAM